MPVLETILQTGMSDSVNGGVADTAGVGMVWAVTYTAAPVAAGSYLTLKLLDSETLTIVQVGGSDTAVLLPTFTFTYNNKVYFIAGSQVFFSEIGEPRNYNNPDGIGNGFVTLANQSQSPEDIVAMATIQGRVAFFARRTTHIWTTNPDPTLWSLEQVLQNIGTVAKLSVQQVGDLDVLFLSDTGVRSLRARESTLNAYVDDIGSPIDSLIQTILLDIANLGDIPNACSVIEPSSGRYWLFVETAGVASTQRIYVYSRFPSSKVAAWSQYIPMSSDGDIFFPQKMFVYQGRVYIFDGLDVFQYGGESGNTYDNSPVTVETGFMDLESPGRIKKFSALNAAYYGNWKVEAACDPVTNLASAVWEPVAILDNNPTAGAGTYDIARVPMALEGSHIKLRISSIQGGQKLFSQVVLHYKEGNEV